MENIIGVGYSRHDSYLLVVDGVTPTFPFNASMFHDTGDGFHEENGFISAVSTPKDFKVVPKFATPTEKTRIYSEMKAIDYHLMKSTSVPRGQQLLLTGKDLTCYPIKWSQNDPNSPPFPAFDFHWDKLLGVSPPLPPTLHAHFATSIAEPNFGVFSTLA